MPADNPAFCCMLPFVARTALFLAYHLAGILSGFVRSSVMWNRADYDINRRRFAQCVPVHTGFAARFVYIAGWRSAIMNHQVFLFSTIKLVSVILSSMRATIAFTFLSPHPSLSPFPPQKTALFFYFY